MDSINQQQPEKNHEDLQGSAAKARIKDMAKDGSCFFCTDFKKADAFATRPMAVRDIDEEGNLWFLSAYDSKKNHQISIDPVVQLLFQGSSYSEFLTLFGSAEIILDKQRIKELWSPILKTWFTEGVDDPRITAIKVTLSKGYYWDTKHGAAVSMIKQAAGAIIGKTLDDSIEGSIRVE